MAGSALPSSSLAAAKRTSTSRHEPQRGDCPAQLAPHAVVDDDVFLVLRTFASFSP